MDGNSSGRSKDKAAIVLVRTLSAYMPSVF